MRGCITFLYQKPGRRSSLDFKEEGSKWWWVIGLGRVRIWCRPEGCWCWSWSLAAAAAGNQFRAPSTAPPPSSLPPTPIQCLPPSHTWCWGVTPPPQPNQPGSLSWSQCNLLKPQLQPLSTHPHPPACAAGEQPRVKADFWTKRQLKPRYMMMMSGCWKTDDQRCSIPSSSEVGKLIDVACIRLQFCLSQQHVKWIDR